MKYDYVALGPGGAGFFCLLGVLMACGKYREVSGASAGALAATLVVAAKGDVSRVVKDSVDVDIDSLTKVDVRNFISFYGMIPRVRLQNKLEEMLVEYTGKKHITFGELYSHHPVKLHVATTSLEKKQTVYFSVDSHPDMRVSDTVMASVAVPLVFTPVYIGEDTYVDGGCCEKVPLYPFLLKDPKEVLAVELSSEVHKGNGEARSMLKHFRKVVDMMLCTRHEYSNFNTQVIELDEFDNMDFSLDGEEKIKLVAKGYQTVANL